MFETVNELAVLGTTFLMMAIATVWYSSMAFGDIWMREAKLTDADIEKAKPHMWSQVVFTFVSYFVMLLLLAHIVWFAPMINLSVINAALLVTLFVAAASAGPVIWEGKSIKYYFVSVGFFSVFIIIGCLILQYWPW